MQRLQSREWLVKPIGEDRVADLPILKLHLKSSLSRSPVLQILFDVSKEPQGQGNCVLATFLARLGRHGFLLFFHLPLGGCNDPSVSMCTTSGFSVARFGRAK